MDKRTEKKVARDLGVKDMKKFHEATLAAEADMLTEEDFVPLEEDPDMEAILEDDENTDNKNR